MLGERGGAVRQADRTMDEKHRPIEQDKEIFVSSCDPDIVAYLQTCPIHLKRLPCKLNQSSSYNKACKRGEGRMGAQRDPEWKSGGVGTPT